MRAKSRSRGAGTRVAVPLPLVASSDASSTALPATPCGNGEVILVVDDESLLLELTVQLVTDLGYVALAYTSSRDALQALFDAPAKVDLVLTDENMPELSGSELVAEIRAGGLDVPVIMMSGNVTTALKERARAASVCALLGKPLREASIAAALARCLRPKARP
jgi:CheY-like chemotaxis protein